MGREAGEKGRRHPGRRSGLPRPGPLLPGKGLPAVLRSNPCVSYRCVLAHSPGRRFRLFVLSLPKFFKLCAPPHPLCLGWGGERDWPQLLAHLQPPDETQGPLVGQDLPPSAAMLRGGPESPPGNRARSEHHLRSGPPLPAKRKDPTRSFPGTLCGISGQLRRASKGVGAALLSANTASFKQAPLRALHTHQCI